MILRTSFTIACLSTPLAWAQINLQYQSNTPPGVLYIEDNFFGISFELQVINTIIGNTPDTIPTPIHNYLANIRNRTTNPIRLRVGGNSMDNSYYVPAQSPMISGNVDNINYTPITFGPVLVDTISALADNIGGAIWDVSLGLIHLQDWNNTVNLARYATEKLGTKLDSFPLGNEPDLYFSHAFRPGQANYTVQNYIDDYAYILGQMHSIPALTGSPMAGPTICCVWDLYTLLTNGYLGAFRNFLKYITLQHYPQNNCVPGAQIYQLNYYLMHSNVVGFATWNIQGVIVAQQAGLNVSMTEFNSVSCGGIPGISNTFGAAMWTIDYVFQLASLGYNSAYIHTREAGVTYNLFDPPLPTINQNLPGWTTGPPYHALLVVAEALHSPSASSMAVVDLNLPSPANAPNTLAGYALYPSPNASVARMPPARFVLFNYALSGTATIQFNQNVTGIDATTGASLAIGDVIVKYLLASSVTAALNITWAGQVVDGGGVLQGTPTSTAITGCGSAIGCAIAVPGPGVAVVYLDGESGATIAGGSSANTTSTTANAGATSTFLLPSTASRLPEKLGAVYLAVVSLISVLLLGL